jgi:hypothetical protein
MLNEKTPRIVASVVMPKPKRTPAIIFPQRTEMRDSGAERKRSKVRIRRSMGMATGPMLLEAQNTVCAASSGMSFSFGISLPIVNVKKRAIGNRIPNIKAGGRR